MSENENEKDIKTRKEKKKDNDEKKTKNGKYTTKHIRITENKYKKSYQIDKNKNDY